MMKKFILNSLITTLVFGGAVIAYAEDGSAQDTVAPTNTSVTNTKPPVKPRPVGATLQENREKIQDVRQKIASTTMERRDLKKQLASSTEDRKELRGKIASTTMERRDERKELIKTRIENKFGKMFERFQATIDREKAIMDKINTRIAKIKANGGSTSEAEKLVAEAKTHLDAAQTALDSLKTTALNDSQIASSTTGAPAKETLDGMRKAGQDVEKHLRSAHQALQKSIGSLRGVSQLRNASSTKEREGEQN